MEQTVESVNNATRQINSLMQESQTAFSPEELDKVSAKLADCVKRAGADAQRGKRLLDELKARGDALSSSNPRSDRLQPYKSQYMRLCKMYVDAMKEHQKSKVGVGVGGGEWQGGLRMRRVAGWQGGLCVAPAACCLAAAAAPR